jgi:nucleoside-diphosphate-sugar epimerase
MKRVLLTGGSGFVGRHCIAPLRELGFEVHSVSHARSGDAGSVGVIWHRADLLDRQETRQLIESVRPTHLLHAAWYAVPGKFWSSSQNLRWVEASLNLLEAFEAAGGLRVVIAGTCAEYSWEGTEALSEATTKLAPATLYGTCKHALHTILAAFARQSSIGYAWGRIFFPYGPHDHAEKLVSYAVRSLLRGEPVNCTQGQQVRDFIYVEDAGRALAALLDSEVAGAVNIASGEGVALKDLLESAAALTGRRDLLRMGALPTPDHEPASLVADVTRLRQEVGFAPAFTLERGIEATVEWWRQRLSAEAVGAGLSDG